MASYGRLLETQRIERFPPRPPFRDVVFLVLFVVHVAAFLALFGTSVVLGKVPPASSNDGSMFLWLAQLSPREQLVFATLTAICFAMGTVMGAFLLALLRIHPVALIWVSLCLGMLMTIAFAVWACVVGQYVIGALLSVVALFNVFFVIFARERVALTAALLSTASAVVKQFPAQIVLALLLLVVHLAYVIAWSLTLTMSQQLEAIRGPLPFVFLVLSFYWTHQVLQNVLHTVCCGVVATWYFIEPDVMPARPTVASFKRASSYSLGSIALGSLIVSLIQMLRAFCSLMRMTNHDLIVCLMDCLLSVIERMVEWFNTYAFSYVAIYGLSFTSASRRVWRLLMDRGWTALINDSLTSGVLVWGALSSGVVVALCVLFVGAAMSLVDPSALLGGVGPYIGILGFCVGYSTVSLMVQVVASGVTTMFVCCAEAPAVLQHRRPQLYDELLARYPELMNGIVEPTN